MLKPVLVIDSVEQCPWIRGAKSPRKWCKYPLRRRTNPNPDVFPACQGFDGMECPFRGDGCTAVMREPRETDYATTV
jgi:hypothetical protein